MITFFLNCDEDSAPNRNDYGASNEDRSLTKPGREFLFGRGAIRVNTIIDGVIFGVAGIVVFVGIVFEVVGAIEITVAVHVIVIVGGVAMVIVVAAGSIVTTLGIGATGMSIDGCAEREQQKENQNQLFQRNTPFPIDSTKGEKERQEKMEVSQWQRIICG